MTTSRLCCAATLVACGLLYLFLGGQQGCQRCTDLDGDGYAVEGGDCGPFDCDDADPIVYWGADEVCNGRDESCDGMVDEGADQLDCSRYYYDGDRDGYGVEPSACRCFGDEMHSTPLSGDCDDGDVTVHPEATERCDGLDNDCDGDVDDVELVGPGHWEARAAMPTARNSFATAVVNGLVYTMGGMNQIDSPEAYLGTVEVYDPETDSWESAAPMPMPRITPAVGVIGGEIYLAGGYVWDGVETGFLDRLDRFDPETGMWTELAPMSLPRSLAAGVVLDGLFYVIGGWTDAGGGNAILGTVEVFDPAAGSWSTRAPVPHVREAAAAVSVGGHVLLAGGWDGTPGGYLWDLLFYHPGYDVWPALAPLSLFRCAAAGTVIADRYALFAGGYLDGWPPFLWEVDIFDIETLSYMPAAPLPEGRGGLGAAAVGGRVFAMGGARYDEPTHTFWYPCGEVWEYLPE